MLPTLLTQGPLIFNPQRHGHDPYTCKESISWSESKRVEINGHNLFLILITHTHPFNGPLSGSTRVSRYQKGKTNLDFTGARDSEWQWHQLGDMQVCTSLRTDNHASTSLLKFSDALPAAQPTASKHWFESKSVEINGRTQPILKSYYLHRLTRPANLAR